MKTNLPLLEYSPWSPSKADLAANCGLAFKYRYVDKAKGTVRSAPAKIGVTVHLAQELVLSGMSVGKALDKAVSEVDEDLTHGEIEKTRAFAQSLFTFYKKIEKFKKRYAVKELFLEQKWAVTTEFKPCDFFDDAGMIRGVIDMGLLLENGRLIIIDHKTGKPRAIKHYGTQLDIYAVMGLAHFPEIQGVQCAVNFLASDTVQWGGPKQTKFIETVLQPWLIKHLNNKAKNVQGFKPKVGWQCKWCDYRTMCPEQVENGKTGEDRGNKCT